MSGSKQFRADESMASLLQAVATQRDVAAFETLFRHFAPRLKAYMARQARDGQAAEELMQETMVAVWRKAPQFDSSKGSVSTWIFTIARNLRIDAFRRDRRPDLDPTDPALVPEEAASAEARIEQRQASEQLHDAMAKLSAEQLHLLQLSFFEDHSHSSIATILDIPLGTVKSRMRRAFALLRATLDRSGEAS